MTGITYPNSSTNSFTYNGLDTRVGKTDSSGTATYRRDGVGVTDPVLSDGSATYTPGISERRSGTTTYELNDRLGTGSRQTNTSATTTATRTYDAFGMLVSSTGTFKGPFGFAGAHGYQEDADSGLMLLGHRYYDASTGRFLTRDPVKDGRDWYTYCDNNPIAHCDSTGYGPGQHGGPPPVKVPYAANIPWKWIPDARNTRGGTWVPDLPKGVAKPWPKSPPSASWDPDPTGRHGGGHWDVDDGTGTRRRYGSNGKLLPGEQAEPIGYHKSVIIPLGGSNYIGVEVTLTPHTDAIVQWIIGHIPMIDPSFIVKLPPFGGPIMPPFWRK